MVKDLKRKGCIMSLPFIQVNDNSFVVVIDQQNYNFDRGHLGYRDLVECVQSGDKEEFLRLIDGRTAVENFTEGDFEVLEESLYYKGKTCHSSISDRVIKMMQEGFDYTPMFKFLERVYKNPSNRAINELFEFMAHYGLVITGDGYLYAYKGVHIHKDGEFKDSLGRTIKEGDYVDGYTGRAFRYNPGDVVEMPRNEVCDDFRVACGPGLHAGSPNYSLNWADTPVIVKIDPADVVSVPSCSDCQKLRACKIEIVSDFERVFDKVIEDYNENDFDYDEEDDSDECSCGSGLEESGYGDCGDCAEDYSVEDDFNQTDWKG
jgi:hypothetical protein